MSNLRNTGNEPTPFDECKEIDRLIRSSEQFDLQHILQFNSFANFGKTDFRQLSPDQQWEIYCEVRDAILMEIARTKRLGDFKRWLK